ncbi:exopolysaccharide biosynthesis polyprenyl glycosylphosphotransferase [Calidifontibacter sp. DB0510]|uniref:Exopolysaccharide biosynthesis polyprenyl glycosylphosphotransferase n=2 Tax=Metallococcus carri TaxID=1656884 RepID=A0A967B3B1_9MICO|nr:exopolysaccharide biosynthesis polyprenyl glycosylphosphotransferase [Metallococcus carri]NOP38884.1 exopolysaccharide biosynthesis polyprenyl glycosylphosphotransferase [Calidifontibacter sp. DB2511S]
MLVATLSVVHYATFILASRRFPERTLRIVAEPTPGQPCETPMDPSVVSLVTTAPSLDSSATTELVEQVRREVDRSLATAVEVEPDVRLSSDAVQHLAWALRDERIPLRFLVATGQLRSTRTRALTHGGTAALEVAEPTPGLRSNVAKRVFDVLGSIWLIIAFAPLLAVVAILVKTTSRGPVIYRQTRVGRNGEDFEIFKFRSMKEDADSELQALLAAQGTDGTPLFKPEDDPRITPLGRFIRRYSIDELPQLFNALGGSMSLVGPRPQRRAEVALYDSTDYHRLGVRPGLTGLWQVSGRSRLSWEQAVALDVDYAHNWTVWLDIKIIARTIKAVLMGDGAR